MKLLICASEYYPSTSGIANVAYNVVEQLKKMGVKCTVCSPFGPDIKLGSRSMIQKYGLLGILYYWHRVSKYFKKRADYYDGVWLHDPLFIRNNPFQKGLITMHGTYYLFSKFVQSISPLHIKIYYKIAAKTEKYCLNKINFEKKKITGVSQHVCKALEEIGIDTEEIVYIPNGVDINKFKPIDNKKLLRDKFGIPKNDIVILSLCRLTKHKRVYELIELFSLIEEEIKDITLVIAGAGELLEQMKEFALKKNVKNVKFLGYVEEEDKPYLYACADFYIMASKYEGHPLTLLEAMASRLSCIVSNIPGMGIVEDANCGIVVDFNDVEKTTEKIIEYIRKDNFNYSKNAREYAVKNLDWKIIARRYLEEFEKMLQKRGEEQ